MTDYASIRTDRTGDVVVLTMARPDRLNALSFELFDELADAIDAAVAGGARALVLTGEGRFFSSGADLAGGADAGVELDLAYLAERYYNGMARKLAALDIPLVTALNGPAAGAGVSLALAGDIVIMAEDAYLLMAFVNMGLVPDAGATWLVARGAGRARALELALLGERMGAAEARAVGLVTRVVPAAEVAETALEIARRLASGPTLAIGTIRKQVAFAVDHDFEAVLSHERDNQGRMGRSVDFGEAVSAFLEKRKPHFSGA